MFNKIYNPITKTNLDIKSKSGRDLLTKYIKQYLKLSKSNMKGGNITDKYYRFGFEFEFCSGTYKLLDSSDGVIPGTGDNARTTCPPRSHNSTLPSGTLATWGRFLDCDYDSSVKCGNGEAPHEMILTSKYQFYWDGINDIIIKDNESERMSRFKASAFFGEIINDLLKHPLLATKCALNNDGNSTCGLHLHISYPSSNINNTTGRYYLGHILQKWQGITNLNGSEYLNTLQKNAISNNKLRKLSRYSLQMPNIPRNLWTHFILNPSEENTIKLLKYNQDKAGITRHQPGPAADRYQSLNVISRPDGKPNFCEDVPLDTEPIQEATCYYGNNKIKGSPKTKPYPVHIELRGHDDFIKVLIDGTMFTSDNKNRINYGAKYLMTYLKQVIEFMNIAKAETTNDFNTFFKPDISSKNRIWYPRQLSTGIITPLLKIVAKNLNKNMQWVRGHILMFINSGTRDVDGIIDRLEDESFSNPIGDWCKGGGAKNLSHLIGLDTLAELHKVILLSFLEKVQIELKRQIITTPDNWAIKQYEVLINSGTDTMKRLRNRISEDDIEGPPGFTIYDDNNVSKLSVSSSVSINPYTHPPKPVLDIIKYVLLKDVIERVQRRIVKLSPNYQGANNLDWANKVLIIMNSHNVKSLYGVNGFEYNYERLIFDTNIKKLIKSLFYSHGYEIL